MELENRHEKRQGNTWVLGGEEPAVEEIPYWKTINRYLGKVDSEGLLAPDGETEGSVPKAGHLPVRNACEGFFQACREREWHYILRLKEGGIPTPDREEECRGAGGAGEDALED